MERDSSSEKFHRFVAELRDNTLQWRERDDESQAEESAVSDLRVDQVAEDEHLERALQQRVNIQERLVEHFDVRRHQIDHFSIEAFACIRQSQNL